MCTQRLMVALHQQEAASWAFICLTAFMFASNAQAVSYAVTGGAHAGEGLGIVQHRALASTSRSILQQAEDIAPSQATPPSDGPFANIEPCQDLLDILTDEPDPGSRLALGNFTQAPTEQELVNCAVQNSAFLFDGRELATALAEPLPMLKVVTLQNSVPIQWPVLTSWPRTVPGSVNLINCQSQFLDIRNWPIDQPAEESTMLFLDCYILFPDLDHPLAALQWNIHTSISFPCDGESFASQGQANLNTTRAQPMVFPMLDEVIGSNSGSHGINVSSWCYTQQDIDDIFSNAEEETSVGGEDSSLPSGAVWAIGVGGAVLLLTAALVTVWLCCGRPCWGCCQPRDPYSTAQHTKDRPSSSVGAPAAPSVRSTEELAEALSGVLRMYRSRNLSSAGAPFETAESFSTNSHAASHYYDPYRSVPEEWPDVGRPHSEQPRYKRSLRAATDTHSSGSTGIRGGPDSVSRFKQFSDHPSSAALHHRSVSESDDASQAASAKHLSARARATGARASPHRDHAPRSITSQGSNSMDAWVEDSLQARRAIATGVQGTSSRHHAYDNQSVASTVGGAGTSISLAPYRKHTARGAIDAVEAALPTPSALWAGRKDAQPTAHNTTRGAGGRVSRAESQDDSTEPSSEAVQFCDAQETMSTSWSPSSSPTHQPQLASAQIRILEPLKGLMGARESPRKPRSRSGSSRQGLVVRDLAGTHVQGKLAEYQVPPSTHPHRDRISPPTSREAFVESTCPNAVE